MNVKPLVLGLTLSLLAAPALAFHCPRDMKAIDAALEKNPQLSMSQMDAVKKLRAEGERLHNAGDHQKSVDTLARAMKMLGIE